MTRFGGPKIGAPDLKMIVTVDNIGRFLIGACGRQTSNHSDIRSDRALFTFFRDRKPK